MRVHIRFHVSALYLVRERCSDHKSASRGRGKAAGLRGLRPFEDQDKPALQGLATGIADGGWLCDAAGSNCEGRDGCRRNSRI